VKTHVAAAAGSSPHNVYHTTIMPCPDKKLEASREDFYSDVYQTRDVDLVLTSSDVQLLIEQEAVDFAGLELTPMDSPLHTTAGVAGDATSATTAAATVTAISHRGGSAGGYLEHVFRGAASEMFGVHNPTIEYVKQSRRSEIQEVKLVVGGETKLIFAAAYGMSSIANIVRKMKQGKCKYHYIEIMACPKGCNNGGGQIKPTLLQDQAQQPVALPGLGLLASTTPQSTAVPDASSLMAVDPTFAERGLDDDAVEEPAAAEAVLETNAMLLSRVDALYNTLPIDDDPEANPQVQHLYATWLGPAAADAAAAAGGTDPAAVLLRTEYHPVTNNFAAPQLEEW